VIPGPPVIAAAAVSVPPLVLLALFLPAVLGIALSVLAVRSGRRFGAPGYPPRLLARLSMLTFILAIGEALLGLARSYGRPLAWMPGSLTDDWVVRVMQTGLVAVLLLAASALWNWILGVRMRRRVAHAELVKRTARAFDPIARDLTPPIYREGLREAYGARPRDDDDGRSTDYPARDDDLGPRP
jgi:hypothetical protein